MDLELFIIFLFVASFDESFTSLSLVRGREKRTVLGTRVRNFDSRTMNSDSFTILHSTCTIST
jgi:hypothetical protein